ncbi:MAG: class I SAM-dependent methyltransferase [Microcoleaceae cyanobacterium]
MKNEKSALLKLKKIKGNLNSLNDKLKKIENRIQIDPIQLDIVKAQSNPQNFQKSEEYLGKNLNAGDKHYRAFVGPPEKYDLVAAMQFNIATHFGLREEHFFLDIGCGSLRAGRLFIPYLLSERYFGVEPNAWLIEEGIRQNIGKDLIKIKRPYFSSNSDFDFSEFNKKFDFLLAQSIFSHASQSQIKKCFSEARKVMKENSIFLATFVEGESNYSGERWVYPSCVTYTIECIINLAEEQGLICKRVDFPHPNAQSWLAISQSSLDRDITG